MKRKVKKVLAFLLTAVMMATLLLPAQADDLVPAQTEPAQSPVAGSTAPLEDEVADTSDGDETADAPEETPETEEPTDAELPQGGDETTPDSAEPAATPQEKTADHIAGCSDGCTVPDCACPCHVQSLFDRLMACDTFDEMLAIADTASEEEILALTDEENAQIEAKAAALEPEALPPAEEQDLPEETTDEQDAPVPSEIVYPTVNFDQVAPFGAPVEG